ncbi:hypothetical protein BGZ72_007679 [Mortierella alpina]|nr:hypothetical protein BGZ72_007679 [Mortierella alpina]
MLSSGDTNDPHPKRSDDGRDGENSLHSKKQKPDNVDQSQQGPQQPIATEAQSGPSNANQPFLYLPGQGLRGMRKQAEQQSKQQTQQQSSQDSEDEVMDNSDEWHEVVRTKDNIDGAAIKSRNLFGVTDREKFRELNDLIIDAKVHCIEGPFKIRIDGEGGFRMKFETEEQLQKILALEGLVTDIDGMSTQQRLFTRLQRSDRQTETARTVEVYGIHPRTPEARIRSAMSRFGEIEFVRIRACSRGIKSTASVVFFNNTSVEQIKGMGLTAVFVGRDLARLRTIGEDRVDWQLGFVAKLSCLPFGTNALDLRTLLGKGKADFITVPQIYSRDGRQQRYQREAFVYFKTEEDMEKTTSTPVKIGEVKAIWGSTEEKRCRECHKLGHIQKECDIYKEVLKTKEHVKMVREYQRGGPLRVTKERSYASLAGGSDAQQQMSQQQTGTEQATVSTQQAAKETSKGTAVPVTQHKGIEKKMNELKDTIDRLHEVQQQLMAQNQVLMQLVIAMLSNNMGVSVPAETLMLAGLSGDPSKNAMKSKAKSAGGGIAAGILQTNESLAGIMGLITNNKSAQVATAVQGKGKGKTPPTPTPNV